jgi:tripartite-type tricarboxylate transporter receptor subunit TctC
MARLLADPLREDLGQMVIVENKGGGNGIIGSLEVARAAPDGYTVLLVAGALAIAPSVYAKLPFDPVRDLKPIALVAHVPLVLVTKNDSPVSTVADLVALARRSGDKVTFASFGNATPSHLVGESMNQLSGLKMTHVPYKGSAAALTEVMGGFVTFGILDAFSMTPQVKSGRVKAIAVTGPKRFHALPEYPTLVESGIAFDSVGWHGIFAPAAIPPAIANRLNAAFVKAAGRADIRERIVAGGSVPIDPPLSVEQWSARFLQDVEQWGRVARAAKITADAP